MPTLPIIKLFSLIASVYSSALDSYEQSRIGLLTVSDRRCRRLWCDCLCRCKYTDGCSTSSFQTLYLINYKCNMIVRISLRIQMPQRSKSWKLKLFWRVWAYMNLIRGWGTPPLVDHVLTSGELQPSNGTPSALGFCLQKFTGGYQPSPSKAGKNGQIALGARVTKEAAYALLGKSYLLARERQCCQSSFRGFNQDFGSVVELLWSLHY